MTRKSGSEDSSPAFESKHSFLARFAERKHSIEASLKQRREGSGPDSKSSVKSDLGRISSAIEDLQKLVAENSYFLPSYQYLVQSLSRKLKIVCSCWRLIKFVYTMHANNTNIYLRVRSRPIIEDSCGVRFAPYNLIYDGLEKDLKDSRLEEETGSWAN
ncbi:hypothetical protein H6P81_010898 [Aristolochia fimbriata]|uniref:Tubulin-folding cofactor C n=1 Tax=Aristolochia fimbriata TaxID=158543 RepID=A0AAV7EUH6_ARIFI|nr:hypothetical protein H6P81_010898 [Aristolochia fimbriata]